MSLGGILNQPYTLDIAVDKSGRLMPYWINWFNQLTQTINSTLVSGRDSLGGGATKQKTIPFLQVPSMDTATRDSVAGLTNGLMIYNVTTNKFQGYAGGAWVDFH